MLSNATIIQNDDGSSNVALFLDGEAYLAHSSHSNFDEIMDAIRAGDTEADYETLFDTGKLVQGKFEEALAQVEDQVLSERIAVRGGEVTLDGDPVSGSLEDQILQFVREGADFGPLVRFYEKLITNPLGNVKQGVFDWSVTNGLTITESGNLLGYKSVAAGVNGKYRPSRASRSGKDLVNGVEVGEGNEIWQGPGDVVEMPRSKVLNAPSQACGTGLHIGTFDYAQRFYGGDTVLLVEFNPRDIVSLPDSNSTWKLRVCRYTVVKPVTEALDEAVYAAEQEPEPVTEALDEAVYAAEQEPESVEYDDIYDGAEVELSNGETGIVTLYGDGSFNVGPENDRCAYSFAHRSSEDGWGGGHPGEGYLKVVAIKPREGGSTAASAKHGKGGPHSKEAEGNGLHPAQDRATGRFVNGRPGSERDSRTGRFASSD